MGAAAHGSTDTVSVVGTLTVRPEHEDEFLAITAATAELVLEREPGTILYALHRHPTEPHTFFFIERYRDQRALAEHAAAPYMQEAMARVQQLLAGPPDAQLLQQLIPAGGPGVTPAAG